jgi:hypothetical protein
LKFTPYCAKIKEILILRIIWRENEKDHLFVSCAYDACALRRSLHARGRWR